MFRALGLIPITKKEEGRKERKGQRDGRREVERKDNFVVVIVGFGYTGVCTQSLMLARHSTHLSHFTSPTIF
jgi:hypothetical protein